MTCVLVIFIIVLIFYVNSGSNSEAEGEQAPCLLNLVAIEGGYCNSMSFAGLTEYLLQVTVLQIKSFDTPKK